MSDLDPSTVIAQWQWRHSKPIDGDLLFVERLREQGLDDRAIAAVLTTINDICTACWNAEGTCYCTRDD